MADDGMALTDLLQKSGDDNFLRSVAEVVLQILTLTPIRYRNPNAQ